MSDRQDIVIVAAEEVLRQMPAGVVIAEAPSGKIIFINRQAQQWTEQSRGQTRATKLEDAGDFQIYHPHGRPYEIEEWPLMRSITSGEEIRDEEFVYPLADGARLWLRCDSSPIYDDEGQIIAGVLVAHDVSEPKLAEERIRFQAHLLDAVGQAVIAIDMQGKIIYWNHQAEELYGWSTQEVIDRLARDVQVSEDQVERAAEITSELRAGRSWTGEFVVRRRDGTTFPAMVTDTPVRDERGDLVGLIGVSMDITERKRAEEALQESNRQIENILETITDQFYALDREGRYTYINERALDNIRKAKGEELTREDVLGKSVWEWFPKLVGSVIHQKFNEALREQKPVHYEAYSPGSYTWYEVHAYPSKEGLSVYSRDITKRKRAEEHLAYHAYLLENIHDAVIATDEQLLVTAWNKGAEQMYGWTADEVLGRHLWEVVPTDLSDEQRAEALGELAERGRFRTEALTYGRDGTPVYVEGITIALREESDGEITGYVNIRRDITERKRAEEALRYQLGLTETITDKAADPMLMLDAQGRITFANPAAEQMFGWSREELLGEVLHDKLHHHYPDGRPYPRSECPIMHALATQRTLRDHEDLFFRKDASTVEISCSYAPFVVEGEVAGAVLVVRDITERKKAEQEIETRTQQQAVVAELGLRALENDDLQSLMDVATALVSRTLGVEYSKVMELLPGGKELLLQAGVGWDEGLVGRAAEGAGLDSQAGYTLLVGEPVILEDLSTETRFRPSWLVREHRAVSGMSVVIHGQDEPFGVLSAYTREHGTFSEDDVDFLQAVANVLATAIERRGVEERVEEGREAERSRLARDLHDEPLQHHTDALIQLQQIQSFSEDPEQTLRLVRLRATLDRIEPQLRGAIYDLRLEGEQEKPFPELLESLVVLHRGMAPDSEIAYEVHDGVLSGPLGERGRQLLRILGEALTNVRRHSGAHNVRVGVGIIEGKLWAEVQDDGRGFDVAQQDSEQVLSASGGLGISGMRERARALGGDIKIESNPQTGTRVRFELAITPEREQPQEEAEEAEEAVRILLVEDHATLREALASSFEQEQQEAGFEVVGQAGSLEQARRMLQKEELEAAEEQPIDVAVIDLGLPDGYGGDLIKDLREAHPQAQALVLSATLDRVEIARAVEKGAAGVLNKTAHLDEVVEAVGRLRRGETLLPLEEVVELLRYAGSRRAEEYEARQAIEKLTPREKEVLQALAEGLDSEGIASKLSISIRTERNHMASILSKLGVHSQLQALVFALRYGVVKLP